MNDVQDFLMLAIEGGDYSSATRRAVTSDLTGFVAWYEQYLGAFSAAALTVVTITSWRADLVNAGQKPATINRKLISLKKFTRWATARGLMPDDVGAPVKLLTEVEQLPRELTDQEENKIMAAVRKHGTLRDQAILTLILHTGLRESEVCQLRTSDVQVGERSGRVVVRSGKGGKRREIPLNITARRAVAAYLAGTPPAGEWLWPGDDGGHLGTRGLYDLVKKYARFADVQDVSPHDLRHRFAYRLKNADVPESRIADLMGHSDLNTTRVYGRSRRKLETDVDALAWE